MRVYEFATGGGDPPSYKLGSNFKLVQLRDNVPLVLDVGAETQSVAGILCLVCREVRGKLVDVRNGDCLVIVVKP